MSNSKLIELSYYDPSAQVRLSAYADTIVLDHDQNGSIISAIRFGGYPEWCGQWQMPSTAARR